MAAPGTALFGCAVYNRRAGRWQDLADDATAVDDATRGGPPLDQRFVAPGAVRDVTVGEILDAMRAAGLSPYRGGRNADPARDAAFAERLLTVLPRAARSPVGAAATPGYAPDPHVGDLPTAPWSPAYQPDPDIGPPQPIFDPEAGTAPSDWLGVAEPACPTDPSDEAIWGRYDQIIADLRDMGAGAIRRCKWRDVYWGSLFPVGGDAYHGAQVPPPADILAELRADGHARLEAFTELLLVCRSAGIKMAITPWNPGGGSIMNVASDGAAKSMDAKSPLYDDDGKVTDGWQTLLSLRPAWQLGVRVLSTHGWDPFYWDPADMPGVSATTDQVFFQRYATQTWPTRPSDLDGADEYTRECARRKSLAIAAFCQGVAEHLAAMHELWGQLFHGSGIYDVVDTVELGNELNGLFQFNDHDDDDDDDDVVVVDASVLAAQ